MTSAIQQAIQQAAAAAEKSTASLPAVQSQTGSAVAPATARAPALSMATVGAGGINVDAWIKPKEFGLQVGDSPSLFDSAKVSLDMSDGKGFVVKLGIKAGNPAQYFYSADGVTCTTGGSWEAACAKARALDPTAREYRSVDLPFTLLEDIVVKNAVVAKAGMKLGYTTSTTNWKSWAAFHAAVVEAELEGQEVVLDIGSEPRVNKAGNKWGTMTFKLVGAMEELVATDVTE